MFTFTFRCAAALIAIVVSTSPEARAATFTWDGGELGNNLWSSNSNWLGDTAPSAGATTDDIIFGGALRLAPELDQNRTVRSLTFNNTAGAFTLVSTGASAFSLTISSGGITNNDADLQTISHAVTLGASQVWSASSGALLINGSLTTGANTLTVKGAFATTFGNAITGSGAVAKAGAGTLTFLGPASNTYMGVTSVEEGILVLHKTGAATAIAGSLTVGDGIGGALVDRVRLDGSDQIANSAALSILSSGLFDLNGFSDAIGTLSLTGGGVTTGAGTLTLGGGVTSNASPQSANISGNLSLGGLGITFDVAEGVAANDLEISSVISNGNLDKNGTGQLVFSGAEANTYGGSTIVYAGTLLLNKVAGVNAIVGNVSIQPGAVLRLGAANQIANSAVVGITGTGLFDLNGFDEAIGTLSLSGVTIQTGSGTLTIAGAGIASDSSGPCLIGGYLGLAGGLRTLSVNDGVAADDLTISAVISNGGLFKGGPGTVVLSGANTFSGGLTQSEGLLALANDAAAGTGMLTLAGGILQARGAARTLTNAVRIDAASTISGTLDLTLNGSISGSGNLAKLGTGFLTLGGTTANSYNGFLSANGGTLFLNKPAGVNAASNISISGGAVLRLGAAEQISNSSSVTISNTSQFDLNGFDETILILTLSNANLETGPATLAASRVESGTAGPASISGNLGLRGTTGRFIVFDAAASNDLTVSAVISDGVTKEEAGQLVFNGTTANTYTGDTMIDAGTLVLNKTGGINAVAGNVVVNSGGRLRLGAPEQIANTSTVSISPGGQFDLDGFNELISALNLSSTNLQTGTAQLLVSATISSDASGSSGIDGNLILGASGTLFTVADSAATDDLTVSAAISGGPLIKAGLGQLVLSGSMPNSYSGYTEVVAGTLLLNKPVGVNATGGSVVTINPDAIVRLGARDQLSDITAVRIFGSGQFDLNGFNETIDALILDNSGIQTGGATLTVSNVSIGNGQNSIGGNLSLGGGTRTFSVVNSAVVDELTISAVISNGGVIKRFEGELVFSGTLPNTYTGPTIINAGTLRLNKPAGVNAIAGNVFVNPGGVLRLGANDQIADIATAIVTGTGQFALNGFNETISGLSLANASVQTGIGVLNVTDLIASDSTGPSNIGGNLGLGGGTRTISVEDVAAVEDLTITATISNGGIAKSGPGQLFLNSPTGNAYAAGTSIDEGTLRVENVSGSGTGSGSVFVADRGTLSGRGILSGEVTVKAGGSIAPGASTGTLQTGALTLGGTFALEIGGANAGTGYDQLVVTGSVALGGDLKGALLDGFMPFIGDLFFIVLNDGVDAVDGSFANATGLPLPIAPTFNTITIERETFGVSYTGDFATRSLTGGNDVVLFVPEPGSAASMLGGVVLLALTCRGRARVRNARITD